MLLVESDIRIDGDDEGDNEVGDDEEKKEGEEDGVDVDYIDGNMGQVTLGMIIIDDDDDK